MITELFYPHIININRGYLHNEISGVYTSPYSDTDELKMALRARKISGAFEKRAPGPIMPESAENNFESSGKDGYFQRLLH